MAAKKKESLQSEAGARTALLFCRTLGLPLGVVRVVRGDAEVLNARHYDLLTQDCVRLLEKGWAESELKERLYQATREKRGGVQRVSDLVIGCVPSQMRKDPARNLLEETLPGRYHPALQTRTMPRVSLSVTPEGLTESVIARASVSPLRERFTLEDLRLYWEEHTAGAPSADHGERVYGALTWLLERHSLSDVLWAIDSYTLHRDRPARLFDLEPVIAAQAVRAVEVSQWLSH